MVSRPNPKINIGMVDLSCAFTLCDTSKPDSPIVYCSEAFEALTGYKSDEILGKNCRFLQSPRGVDRGPNVPLPDRSLSEGEDGEERSKRRRISPQTEDLGQLTPVSQTETSAEVQSEKTTKRKRDSRDMRDMRDSQHEKDKQTLLRLKALIARREEAQVEVRNYKKGGIPFTNILTTIPVSAASPSERPRYILGLQVDRSMCFL